MTDNTGVVVLAEHECWTLLRSTEVGRLAVCADAAPDIFPINFVVDHGTIVFRTADGSKLSAAVATPSVAFEVDGYDPGADEAWSVVIKGRAQEIKQLHERVESMDLPLFPWHAAPKGHFVRIEPGAISGRRFQVVDRTAWVTPTTGVSPAPQE
jgi:nitroimidazol reductase NimA-like FMN-containing flavoprotein (pyridoxamine 5'-phosphate oxidase superfamily)